MISFRAGDYIVSPDIWHILFLVGLLLAVGILLWSLRGARASKEDQARLFEAQLSAVRSQLEGDLAMVKGQAEVEARSFETGKA